jgi:tRNA nucleotidyltransferase/poly(A) polymerase
MFQFAEVGGAVRDKFLGVDSKDVDFVAIAENPENFESAEQAFSALVKHLKQMGFKGFATNRGEFILKPEFFTVRAYVPDGHPLKERTNNADFVMARKDGPSSDGRRPDFVLPGTLFDDLQRRDFTVNAMAILNGELIDPFGGRQDLKDKILDFVGDSRERIAEDGLRVMRALRFHITKGFDFDSFVWDELNTEFAAEMLMKVSIERIWEELDKMFLFDTLSSIKLIQDLEECVQKAIFRDGLRLVPTLKK